MTPLRPSAAWSRAIVVATMFSATFANNALSPVYVIYESVFRLSPLQLTGIFATYAIAVLLALVCVGRWSDDVGRRPLLVAGSLLLLASTVVFFVAPNAGFLYVARAVLGLATGTLTAAGTAALVDLEPGGDRRRPSLITTLGFLAGAATGPLLVGVVSEYLPHPTRTPFAIELVLESVVFVAVLFLPEPLERHGGHRRRLRLQRPSVPKPARAAFLLAGAVVTSGWMVGGFYGSLSGSMDRELLHVKSHAVAGLLLFGFAAIGGSSQLAARRLSPIATMAIGVAATGSGVALVEASLVSSSAALFLVATVVTGVGNGLAFIGSLALVNDVAPIDRRAEVVAAYNLVAYFALSLPVVGVGLLADHLGLEHATFVFAGVLVAICIATLSSLRVRRLAFATEPFVEVLVAARGANPSDGT